MRKCYLYLILFAGLILVSAMTLALEEADVRDYFKGWDTADIGKVMSHFTADIVYEDVPKAEISKGAVAVKTFVEQFFTEFAGARLAVDSITIGKSGAAAEWTISGGSGEEAWSLRGASVMEHKGGKISKVTDYWDE
ncbi:MAG: nuclear transport factor 2 family protein [Pseudomonadota bacterium]|nr:nuclear transport factor 2 family protein [Pseudomonadota bacterium]